ncbi:MAG: uracil-DNA glycosylase [Burkholderiaceae bacterium]
MTLDARRTELWQAMGLGPIYRLRAKASHALPAVAAIDQAPMLPSRAAHIAQLTWEELPAEVASCRACSLCETRKQTVFGVGNSNADWMLIGEAPGAEEDARGEPFVGQAGRLLNNMLATIGLTREGETPNSVYIANVLKCRPPGNRNPLPEEVDKCEPFLLRQIELIKPALIVVMGRFAAQSLLGTDASIAHLRGRQHQITVAGRRIPVVVTYHPAYLLRNLADKAKSWADLCLASEVNASARR